MQEYLEKFKTLSDATRLRIINLLIEKNTPLYVCEFTDALELGERGLVLSEDHELIYDGDLEQLLDDKESLLKANLIHTHKHRHDGLEHKHHHIHYWG